jgi:mevalonate kinase
MNTTSTESKFSSKILLFGEYSLIHDSMALSIPYESFEGTLTYTPEKLNAEQAKESNLHMAQYSEYLRGLIQNGELKFVFDIEALEEDIAKGIVFDSTIPQGYGVGSSGALVAALYEKYAIEKIPNTGELSNSQLVKLKEALSQMECYFHGKSSGLDPLICYMKRPMLINNKESIDAVGMPKENQTGKGGIFLIDTGMTGETQPLVNLFVEKCKEEGFLHVIKDELIPFNNNCIKSFLKGEVKDMFSNLKELSKFLLGRMSPMIPRKYRQVWKQGIETESYYLKLCGSGGGGFILGFTEDIEKAKKELKDYNIDVIHRF